MEEAVVQSGSSIDALITAAKAGDMTTLRSLAAQPGFNKQVNQYQEGKTALHHAITNGHAEAAIFLVQQGASIDLPVNHGEKYVRFDRNETRAEENTKYYEQGLDAVFLAIFYHDPETKNLKSFIEHLISRDTENYFINKPTDTGRYYGYTPFHYVVRSQRHDLFELMLPLANLEAQTRSSQNTALLLAAERNDVFMCERLVQCGASVDVTNTKGQSPLSHAHAKYSQDLIDLFTDPAAYFAPPAVPPEKRKSPPYFRNISFGGLVSAVGAIGFTAILYATVPSVAHFLGPLIQKLGWGGLFVAEGAIFLCLGGSVGAGFTAFRQRSSRSANPSINGDPEGRADASETDPLLRGTFANLRGNGLTPAPGESSLGSTTYPSSTSSSSSSAGGGPPATALQQPVSGSSANPPADESSSGGYQKRL